jgi:heat shock protein HslJ
MKHTFLPLIAGLYIITDAKSAQPAYATLTDHDIVYKNDTTPSKSNTPDGDWQLMPFLASDTAAGWKPTLRINLKENKFAGNTGCNDMSGSFFLSADTMVFKEQILLTEMECQGYNERAFIDNLTKVNRYRIEDGVLELLNNKTVLSRWARKGSIQGTTNKI